jgi:hypothetical protein
MVISGLKRIFDPSHFYVVTDVNVERDRKSGPELNKKLSEQETKRFDEIVRELEEDLKEMGLNLTFASGIIINEIAMNLIILQKVLFQSAAVPFVDVIHKDIVLLKKDFLEKEYTPLNKEYNLHPFFEKMIFKLQKQINEGLKQLGLLPVQQIERQKLTIVRKLRERCESLDKEYTIKAESQKSLPNKRTTQTQEIKAA